MGEEQVGVGVAVRKASAVDAAEIARVQIASWRRGYAGFYPQRDLDALQLDERVSTWTHNLTVIDGTDSGTTLLAEVHGRVVGFSSVGTPHGIETEVHAVEIRAFYLVEEHWGDGTSGRLMQRTLEESADAARIVLWVLKDNARGRRFYEKWGFVDTGGPQER